MVTAEPRGITAWLNQKTASATGYNETLDAWGEAYEQMMIATSQSLVGRPELLGLAVMVNREDGTIEIVAKDSDGDIAIMHGTTGEGGLTMKIAEDYPLVYLAAVLDECDPPYWEATDRYFDLTASRDYVLTMAVSGYQARQRTVRRATVRAALDEAQEWLAAVKVDVLLVGDDPREEERTWIGTVRVTGTEAKV